ncbi:MAG TPA: hypothetical protein VJ949_09810 [Cryomorphaceae bacterium]|nr:hypothetical protein [Cryomorphaceae bacterium]
MKVSKIILAALFVLPFQAMLGQIYTQPPMDNFRQPGLEGINQFEAPKTDTVPFDGVKVRLGADFAMQFQALQHSNSSVNDTLIPLGNNFNLPTANLNIDAALSDGVRLHLRTYLSSRHHPEAWVKGGHLNIDKLNFIKEGFLEEVMEKVTIRVGLDEINYGDWHFRRTDNAQAIYNPFVGNYILDGFTTEAFGEIYFRHNGWLVMGAISNGKLNQSVAVASDDTKESPSFYGKIGYDKEINTDLRVRLTASAYTNSGDQAIFLYNGDRASSRYYNVMETEDQGDDWSGRLRFTVPEVTSFMINPFVQYKGLEFFGTYEMINATPFFGDDFTYTQIAGDLLYRFGTDDRFYVGGRYNLVTGADGTEGNDISRINAGGGWFLTDNVMTKVEYVQQNYDGDGWEGSRFDGGEFSGVVVEAVISF